MMPPEWKEYILYGPWPKFPISGLHNRRPARFYGDFPTTRVHKGLGMRIFRENRQNEYVYMITGKRKKIFTLIWSKFLISLIFPIKTSVSTHLTPCSLFRDSIVVSRSTGSQVHRLAGGGRVLGAIPANSRVIFLSFSISFRFPLRSLISLI